MGGILRSGSRHMHLEAYLALTIKSPPEIPDCVHPFHSRQVLERSYTSAMTEEDFELLEALLTSNHHDKFDLARDYVITSGLTDTEVSVAWPTWRFFC